MVEKKEYDVPDIEPATFTIQIFDGDTAVESGVAFDVSLDDDSPIRLETEDDGILTVSRPKEKMKLSLIGKEVESTSN